MSKNEREISSLGEEEFVLRSISINNGMLRVTIMRNTLGAEEISISRKNKSTDKTEYTDVMRIDREQALSLSNMLKKISVQECDLELKHSSDVT